MTCDLDDAAARARQPAERARRDRRGAASSTCRSTTIVGERRRRCGRRAHRGELLRLPGGVTLIDDSLQLEPVGADARARDDRRRRRGSARKVAVLGEMLELGAHAERLHAECGRAAAGAGLDLLIAVGGAPAQALADAAVARGHAARRRSSTSPTSAEAADAGARSASRPATWCW